RHEEVEEPVAVEVSDGSAVPEEGGVALLAELRAAMRDAGRARHLGEERLRARDVDEGRHGPAIDDPPPRLFLDVHATELFAPHAAAATGASDRVHAHRERALDGVRARELGATHFHEEELDRAEGREETAERLEEAAAVQDLRRLDLPGGARHLERILLGI